jgi:hypothetical protein
VIDTRRALVAHIRTFVETELAGLYRFDDFLLDPAQKRPEPLEGERRLNRFETHREVAIMRAGDVSIAVESPNEAPPLGRVVFSDLHSGSVEEGPIDPTTWARIGAAIRETAKREGFSHA